MMASPEYDYDSGEFPALYCDASGCEHVTLRKIENRFSFTVRGVEFGGSINGFITKLPQESPELKTFVFSPILSHLIL